MQTSGVSGVRLDIKTTPGKMTIQNKTIRFRKNARAPKMQVDIKRPRMKVDWDGYWAQVGRKSAQRLMESQNNESKQNVSEGIARMASEGDRMMDITAQSPKSQIGMIAFDNTQNKIIEVSSGMMPQEAPKVDWEHGSITISWDYPQMELEWDTDFRPDIEYTPCIVEISVRPGKSSKFAINEKKVAKPVGKKINTMA